MSSIQMKELDRLDELIVLNLMLPEHMEPSFKDDFDRKPTKRLYVTRVCHTPPESMEITNEEITSEYFSLHGAMLTSNYAVFVPATGQVRECRCSCGHDRGDWDYYQLRCQHYFHTRCLRAWLSKGGKLVCPICGDMEESIKNRSCPVCDGWGHEPMTKACPYHRD